MPKPQLASGLSRLKQASGQEPPAPPPAAPAQAAKRTAPRDGLVQIAGHFDPAVRKQLAKIGLDQDRDQRDLLAEALNDLFTKYGQSAIASVYGEGSKSKPRSR